MTRLIVRLENEEKAKLLSGFISELAYVDSVEISNEPDLEPLNKEEDFFSLAGLWKDRTISAEAIRQQAWPERER